MSNDDAEAGRDEVLARLVAALTEDETSRILARFAPEGSHLHGAHADDLIDMADAHDTFVAETDPFYEAHGAELDLLGARFAVIALCIMREPLTVLSVKKLLLRARLLPPATTVLSWEPYGSNAVHHPCSWVARGSEFTYLVLRTAYERCLLARWSRENDRQPELNDSRTHEALETSIEVSSTAEGRRLADRFEQGEDLYWATAWSHSRRPALRTS